MCEFSPQCSLMLIFFVSEVGKENVDEKMVYKHMYNTDFSKKEEERTVLILLKINMFLTKINSSYQMIHTQNNELASLLRSGSLQKKAPDCSMHRSCFPSTVPIC